jgi:hypothetical protein
MLTFTFHKTEFHFPERSMFFEFYAEAGVQKEKIILESTVPHNQLLESVETMLKHFSDLVKHQFPRAYKLFKAEGIVL